MNTPRSTLQRTPATPPRPTSSPPRPPVGDDLTHSTSSHRPPPYGDEVELRRRSRTAETTQNQPGRPPQTGRGQTTTEEAAGRTNPMEAHRG